MTDDMHMLDDTARLARIAIIFRKLKDFTANGDGKFNLSGREFGMCGGRRTATSKPTFSLYRQIVWSLRDLKRFSELGTGPCSKAVGRVDFKSIFDTPMKKPSVGMSNKKLFVVTRLVILAHKARETLRALRGQSLHHSCLREKLLDIEFSREELMACGVKKQSVPKHNFSTLLQHTVLDTHDWRSKNNFPNNRIWQKAYHHICEHWKDLYDTCDDEEVDNVDTTEPEEPEPWSLSLQQRDQMHAHSDLSHR